MEASISLPLTGGCMCGAVRYELSDTPIGAGYCHCTRCQRRSGGSASCSALTKPGTFRIVAGEDVVRCWRGDDGWEKAFCATCGSALFACDPDDPDQLAVRMGSFDSDPGVRPQIRQFVAYAAVWEPIPDDGLPRFDERLDVARLPASTD